MRIVKIVVCAWIVLSLMNWARGGSSFSILEALPFVQRQDSLSANYEWAAVAMLLLLAWGYAKLNERKR